MASSGISTSPLSSCSTSSATSAPWPSAEGLLEASIPGFSILSGVLKSYFHIELSAVIVYLLPIAIVVAGYNYFYDPISIYVTRYGVCKAEIRNDDEMYNYLMYWVSQQTFSSNTLSFVASTRTSSDLTYDPYYDENDGGNQDDDRDVDWQLAEDDFEQFWAQVTKRDRVKNMYFTPCDGRHFFKFRGQYILMNRSSTERQIGWRTSRSETIYLSCLGRDPAVLKDLLKEAQKMFIERDGTSTVVYRKSSDYNEWHRCMSRPPRPLSTVVLSNNQKTAIVEDVKEYLHPLTKRWYANRGIPYRRGYLLYGPPGTGKTSLCVALAGVFNLRVYVASLNSRSLTEEGLATLFGYLPQRCIVLLEDVDSAGLTHKRADEPEKPDPTKPDPEADKTPPKEPAPNGISLSALLNVIDGVASSEGRILIMTTNHVEKLDPALLRPGRVDMSIAFENASSTTAKELFQSTYTSREEDLPAAMSESAAKYQLKRKFDFSEAELERFADVFAANLPSGEFSPADLQGYLLKHKSTPDRAAAGVQEWVVKIREEKARQSKSDAKAAADKDLETLQLPDVGAPTPPHTPIIK